MKLFNTLLFILILIVALYIINGRVNHNSVENFQTNNELKSCDNYLNMTNDSSIDIASRKWNNINEKNLDDINNVRKVLYGTNEENLNKDEYTACNLNLCVNDNGLPNEDDIRNYDNRIKNYFEQIEALEEFKSKITILIINGYIPFLNRLLNLVGTLSKVKNLKIYNDELIIDKINTVLDKADESFLQLLTKWITNHSQKNFLEQTKSEIKTEITEKHAETINLLGLSILHTPDFINKISDETLKTKLLDEENIYSQIKTFFREIYFNELKKKLDNLRNRTKTEMNKLKNCETNGEIIGNPISDVNGGKCALHNNAPMEQKISSCNKICISQIDCNFYTLNGNKCLLYKNLKEVVPSENSQSFKSIKGCNKDKWTVKTLVNSYSGNRRNQPNNQVMIDMNGPIGQNASGTYDFSYAFWLYIRSDSKQWRAILRRGPNYPFYSPGKSYVTSKQRQPGIWIWPGNSYGEFNRLSETNNYKNGRSLHFRFGLEGTGNWNRGIDVPAHTNDGLPLIDKGNNPDTSKNKLGKCEGDCDSDKDCKSGLKCFQRSSSRNVPPGCKPGGSGDDPTHDYCHVPSGDIIKPKTWHHVVFTVKNSREFSAYIDGVRRSHTVTKEPIDTDFNDNFPITMGGGNESQGWGGYPSANNNSQAPTEPGFLVRNVQVFRNTLDQNYINSLMKSDIKRGVKGDSYEQFENYSEVKTALDVRSPQNQYRLPLVNKGVDPDTSEQKLDKCEGDCDSDKDCKPGLKCFQRSSSRNVPPGCKPGGPGDVPIYDYCYDPDPTKLMNKQHKLGGVGKTEKILAKAALEGKTISSSSSLHECNSPSNHVDMIYINTPKTFKDAKKYCKKIGRNLLKFVHPEGDGEGKCGGKIDCNNNAGIKKANRINAFKYYQAVDLLNKGKLIGRTQDHIWVDGSDANWKKPNSTGTINREGTFLNDNLTLTHMGYYNKTGGYTVDKPRHYNYWQTSNKEQPNNGGGGEDCIRLTPDSSASGSPLKLNDVSCKMQNPFICEKELMDPINLSTNVCKDNLKLQNFEKRMGLDPNANRFQKCQQFSDRYAVSAGTSFGCVAKNDWAKSWWSGKHSETHDRGKPITYEEGCTTTTNETIHSAEGCKSSSPYYLGLKIREGTGKRSKWDPDTSINKLGICEGDCDSDSDCKPGLKCFQRSGNTNVPGCTTYGLDNWKDADYCIHDYDKQF